MDYATITMELPSTQKSFPGYVSLLGGFCLVCGFTYGMLEPAVIFAPTVMPRVTTAQLTAAPRTASHGSRSQIVQLPAGENSVTFTVQRTSAEPAPRLTGSNLPAAAAIFAGACTILGLWARLKASASCIRSDVVMATITGERPITDVTDIPSSFVKATDPEFRKRWETMLRRYQESICQAIEACDGEGKFRTDAWVREGGGGGVSRVMAGGRVWEKAGIGLSVVYGTMPTETLMLARERQAKYASDLKPGEKIPFFACGLSCVMHPRDPHCPTMHFNYRYFTTEAGDWWFGGGTDISPAYVDEEDMMHFHSTYKKVCDKHDPAFYPKFKKWADEYFLIKHRGETRGLGGIFFDDLNDRDRDQIATFAEECLATVVPAYVPIIEKNKTKPFTEEQKRWQLLRRGRYVEFNLVYDRGFVFGLKTGLGRVESMMMTIPEVARWEYNHQPAPGSEEEKLLDACRNAREWV